MVVDRVRFFSQFWIGVAAWTTIATGGAGLASTLLSDREGPIGTGAQSLLITPR